MKKIILFCFISLLLISSCKNNDTEITEVTQVSLSQTQAQLSMGDSLSLILSYTPSDLPVPTCTWISSDTTVARVDNKGKIKTVGKGTTTITVATVKTNASSLTVRAQCKVTVTYKGDGSVSNPYLIYTVADLIELRNNVNTKNEVYGNKAYKLMADMIYEEGTPSWTPIGDSPSNSFKGVFDGNGKSIINIWLKQYSDDRCTDWFRAKYVGLFGCIKDATIKNTNIVWKGQNIVATPDTTCYAGGIAGYGSGNISNCHVSGGGLIKFSSKIIGYGGGIIGYGIMPTSITNCQSECTMWDFNYIGGIAGYIIGNISNCCTANKFLYNQNDLAGGVAGYHRGTIVNCYSMINNIYGKYKSGGIAGDGGDIINCYAFGAISGSLISGGIAGSAVSVTNCLALTNNVYMYDLTGIASRICSSFISSYDTSPNYANSSMTVNSKLDLSDTRRNGLNLTAQPVDLLNAYVSANPTFNGISLKRWKVSADVNNGYPVFE